MPDVLGGSAAGRFRESDRRVLVLTYEKFESKRTGFRIPVERRLYQSVATHEVAQALVACNFRIPAPSVQAREYIAHAAMFATISDSHRRRILAACPGDGFKDESTFSAIAYLFDPPRFGVEAYRHSLGQESGAACLEAILASLVLPD